MKIGILTFHDGPNHGAFLQAYSTFKFLEGLGYDVKIINYKNKLHDYQENCKPLLKLRRPSRYIDFFIKKRTFRNVQHHFPLTRFTKKNEDLLHLDFDVVVVGSDVVWNYKIFGFDETFFGKVGTKKLISYAASFGWVDHTEDIRDEAKAGLLRFHEISVRDKNSFNIVNKLIGRKPQIVLDPTLIYEFESEDLSTRTMEPFILVYSYLNNEKLIDQVKTLAKDHGLQTISLGYRQGWCDKVLMDVAPFEWIGMIKQAKFMVASTFHGAIFAIKYEKQFLYVTNVKAKNRVRSLFETCKLNYDLDVQDGVVYEINPDYKKVKQNLSIKIRESQEWLATNVQS